MTDRKEVKIPLNSIKAMDFSWPSFIVTMKDGSVLTFDKSKHYIKGLGKFILIIEQSHE